MVSERGAKRHIGGPANPDPESTPPGTTSLAAYVLYNLCEDAGQCLFRRQDVVVAVQVAAAH